MPYSSRQAARRDRDRESLIAWPERLDGQPFLSWLICGLPAIPLAMLAVALWLTAGFAFQGDDVVGLSWVLGLLMVVPIWPVQALLLTFALWLVYLRYGSDPPLGFGSMWLLMLRVQAVIMLLGLLATLVLGDGVASTIAMMAIWFLVYWKVFELGPAEMFGLVVIGYVVNVCAAIVIASAAVSFAG